MPDTVMSGELVQPFEFFVGAHGAFVGSQLNEVNII